MTELKAKENEVNLKQALEKYRDKKAKRIMEWGLKCLMKPLETNSRRLGHIEALDSMIPIIKDLAEALEFYESTDNYFKPFKTKGVQVIQEVVVGGKARTALANLRKQIQ